MRNIILDIVHLEEPIHSGDYLAEQLINVTNDYGITPGICNTHLRRTGVRGRYHRSGNTLVKVWSLVVAR